MGFDLLRHHVAACSHDSEAQARVSHLRRVVVIVPRHRHPGPSQRNDVAEASRLLLQHFSVPLAGLPAPLTGRLLLCRLPASLTCILEVVDCLLGLFEIPVVARTSYICPNGNCGLSIGVLSRQTSPPAGSNMTMTDPGRLSMSWTEKLILDVPFFTSWMSAKPNKRPGLITRFQATRARFC